MSHRHAGDNQSAPFEQAFTGITFGNRNCLVAKEPKPEKNVLTTVCRVLSEFITCLNGGLKIDELHSNSHRFTCTVVCAKSFLTLQERSCLSVIQGRSIRRHKFVDICGCGRDNRYALIAFWDQRQVLHSSSDYVSRFTKQLEPRAFDCHKCSKSVPFCTAK